MPFPAGSLGTSKHLAQSILLLLFQKMASRTMPASSIVRLSLVILSFCLLNLPSISFSLFPSSQCFYAFSPSPHQNSCISCLLLHNKSPWNLQAWSNNKHLHLSLTVTLGQKLESSYAESLGLEVSHEAVVISRLEWSWNVHFQVGSLTGLAGLHLLSIRGLGFLTHGSLHMFA